MVIEKPVCPTVEEANELIALAEAKDLMLSAYQNRRWDSDFLTVKKLVESGQVGPQFSDSHAQLRL